MFEKLGRDGENFENPSVRKKSLNDKGFLHVNSAYKIYLLIAMRTYLAQFVIKHV